MSKIIYIILTLILFSCNRNSIVKEDLPNTNEPKIVQEIIEATPEDDWLIVGGQKVKDVWRDKGKYFLKSDIEHLDLVTIFIDPRDKNHATSLEGIGYLENLERLSIYGWDLDMLDYSPLENLRNLKSITFECGGADEMTRVPDFSGMAAQDTVTEIEFLNCDLVSFANIETLPNLRFFVDNNASVPSLGPLNRLRYLKELTLRSATFDRSTVFRLEEIGSLKNLEKIKIWTATVDIKGIEQLSSLKEIDFMINCDLINTRNTSIPKSVESILIENRDEYPDIEFIGTAAGLKELMIRADDAIIAHDAVQPPYQIMDVSPLKALSNLEALDIVGFIVKNISALDGLEQMPVIGLVFSQLYDPAEKSKHELILEDRQERYR